MLLRRYHKKATDVVAEANEAAKEEAAREEVTNAEANEAAKEEAEKEANAVAVEEMTVAELKAYAAANNIDLGEATKKADILAAIKNA